MVLNTRVPDSSDAACSRRAFLGAAGVAAAGVLVPRGARAGVVDRLLAANGDVPTAHAFISRPDLMPPTISIVTPDTGSTPGHVLLAPFNFPTTPPSTQASGPLIVDRNGQPLWFRPLTGRTAMDVRVQRYRGAPVLTWWEGTVFGGYGGTFLVADTAYKRVATVKAGNGYKADLHEFLITSRGTALISIYNEVRSDLSSVGGAVDGRLVEGVIQEIDIPSGRVLFEWHSLDHVSPAESFELAVTPDGNVDYFHLNSIGVDGDGHLLISARHTSAVYKVHRRTGKVIWRLGGKRSDFALGPGLTFGYQHDARRHSDGTLTIFDNAASLPTQRGIASRSLRIRLDMSAKTASLARDYAAPDPRTAWAMGNAQQVADGGLFVGWGTFPGLQRDRSGRRPPVRRALHRRFGELSRASGGVDRAARDPSCGRHDEERERVDPGLRELERCHRGGPLAGTGGLEPEGAQTGSQCSPPRLRDRDRPWRDVSVRRCRRIRPPRGAAQRVATGASLGRGTRLRPERSRDVPPK